MFIDLKERLDFSEQFSNHVYNYNEVGDIVPIKIDRPVKPDYSKAVVPP